MIFIDFELASCVILNYSFICVYSYGIYLFRTIYRSFPYAPLPVEVHEDDAGVDPQRTVVQNTSRFATLHVVEFVFTSNS